MNDYCDIEQIAEQPYVVSIDDKPFLNNKSVIIDCGACVGDFSKPLIEKYNCTVYAYEPDIRNYRILKYNLSKYDNAIILNSAISDMDGKEKFYIGEFNTASSLYSSHRGLGKDVYKLLAVLNSPI